MQLIGNGGPRFDDVHEIAVLRGGGLGDLLFAVPALDALAAAYPDARITLLGTPVAPAVLAGRTASVHAFEELPVAPGVRDSGDSAPSRADFDARTHGRFDLAVQLHGGGRNSNPFLLGLGARHTVGTATEDAEVLERWVRYVYYQHEVLRGLEVVSLAGAAPVTLDPRVLVTEPERAAVRERMGVVHRLVALHPGATDPRRRWSPERFAAVARDGSRRGTTSSSSATPRTGLLRTRSSPRSGTPHACTTSSAPCPWPSCPWCSRRPT